jgi:peroxiredoxin Q/BCP
MAQLKIGDLAPSFCLTGHDGKEYCLPELLKTRAVILVFYPYDQSPGCTKLLCGINDDKATFETEGITLLGINNASEESHKAFADKKRLLMPLLSDMNYKVAAAYGVLWKIGPIKVIRYASIGIGQDGRINYYVHGRPSNQEIIDGMTPIAIV